MLQAEVRSGSVVRVMRSPAEGGSGSATMSTPQSPAPDTSQSSAPNPADSEQKLPAAEPGEKIGGGDGVLEDESIRLRYFAGGAGLVSLGWSAIAAHSAGFTVFSVAALWPLGVSAGVGLGAGVVAWWAYKQVRGAIVKGKPQSASKLFKDENQAGLSLSHADTENEQGGLQGLISLLGMDAYGQGKVSEALRSRELGDRPLKEFLAESVAVDLVQQVALLETSRKEIRDMLRGLVDGRKLASLEDDELGNSKEALDALKRISQLARQEITALTKDEDINGMVDKIIVKDRTNAPGKEPTPGALWALRQRIEKEVETLFKAEGRPIEDRIFASDEEDAEYAVVPKSARAGLIAEELVRLAVSDEQRARGKSRMARLLEVVKRSENAQNADVQPESRWMWFSDMCVDGKAQERLSELLAERLLKDQAKTSKNRFNDMVLDHFQTLGAGQLDYLLDASVDPASAYDKAASDLKARLEEVCKRSESQELNDLLHADIGGKVLGGMAERFLETRERAVVATSLESVRSYLSENESEANAFTRYLSNQLDGRSADPSDEDLVDKLAQDMCKFLSRLVVGPILDCRGGVKQVAVDPEKQHPDSFPARATARALVEALLPVIQKVARERAGEQ